MGGNVASACVSQEAAWFTWRSAHLIELCAAMRAAQVRYFTRGRNAVDRDEAIQLERRWDRAYRQYRKLGGQLEMFGNEEVAG